MRNSNCPLSGAPIADYPYEAGSSSYPSQALKLGQILWIKEKASHMAAYSNSDWLLVLKSPDSAIGAIGGY